MISSVKDANIRVLASGQILIEYGPVTMVIVAFKDDKPLTELCRRSFEFVKKILQEITDSLKYLRLPLDDIPEGALHGIALKMKKAVSAVNEPSLTPMASVAGAIAQETADWIFEQGASRVIVNNGGDIALRLVPGELARVGIISDLVVGKVDMIVPVSAESGMGGIATSGLGGRGFTRGIANAVTVFSPNAIVADALATHMANKTYVESENISVIKAGKIDPFSDIAELEVVVEVSQLTDEELALSISQLRYEAAKQYSKKNLCGMIANVQHKKLSYPEDFRQQITFIDN